MLVCSSPRAFTCATSIVRIVYLLVFWLIGFTTCIAQSDQVLLLDGQRAHFEISDNDALDYGGQLTIAAWIYPNCREGLKVLVSKQWCQGDYGYYLGIRNDRLEWSYNIEGNCGNPNSVRSREALFTELKWYHVAVTHDREGIHLYLNGAEIAIEQAEGRFTQIRNSRQPFRIGGYRFLNGTVGSFFSGLTDDLRVWNATLTEAEIATEMRAATPQTATELILSLSYDGLPSGPVETLENDVASTPALTARKVGGGRDFPAIVLADFYDRPITYDLEVSETTCEVATLGVQPGTFESIVWNTGQTSETIQVNESGVYSAEITVEACRTYLVVCQV